LKFPSGTVCGSGCGILESYGIVLTVKRARYSLKSFHFVVVVVDFEHVIFVVVVVVVVCETNLECIVIR
jgi:hypothetical protein